MVSNIFYHFLFAVSLGNKAFKMSENFRLYRKIGFRNMFYTKCINVIIDSIGPSIILRSIFMVFHHYPMIFFSFNTQRVSFHNLFCALLRAFEHPCCLTSLFNPKNAATYFCYHYLIIVSIGAKSVNPDQTAPTLFVQNAS